MHTPAALIYSNEVALVFAALAGLLQSFLSWYASPLGKTNDGVRYQMMAKGRPMPAPFAIRWLLPKALGSSAWRWFYFNAALLPILCVLTALISITRFDATPTQAALAGALMAFTPISRILLDFMITSDVFGMTLMAAMVLVPETYAFVIALVAWSVRENAAVYAAIMHLNPLIAAPAFLAAAIFKWRTRDTPDPLGRQSTTKPLRVARGIHSKTYNNAAAMVLPWGVGLLASMKFQQEPLVFLALLFGYATTFIATDHIRIYQFTAPLVLALAATVVPDALVLPAIVVQFFWPYRKEFL